MSRKKRPIDKKRRETAMIADLVVLEAIGNDWTPADTISATAGLPRIQGRMVACRLAETGAIQQRQITWVSGKSRIRRRFEYRRIPEDRDGWERLPPSIEPPWHPVDCSKARRIAGRNSILIYMERNMISEQDLLSLPRGVQERFREMPDHHFYKHPEVVELRERLETLEVARQQAAHRHHKMTVQIGELEKRAEGARVEAARLNDGRARRLADILLSGDHDLTQDRSAISQVNDLLHFAEAVEAVYPKHPDRRPASELARRLAKASTETRSIVQQMDGVNDALRDVIDRLKLAEAERLAYA